jgi:signal peptidase II
MPELEESKPEPESTPEPEPAPEREPAPPPSSLSTVATKLTHPGYAFLIIVTAVNLVADLASKWWAKSHFENIQPGQSRKVEVIPEVMNFLFAKNRGGAWGLLQNETEALRRPFFLVVSVAAIVFIVSLYRKLQPGQGALKWGLPLVLGGALGNLVDRIRYGFVVDFIDIYMLIGGKVKHWPTFNVADVSICVGVGLMAVDMFTSRKTAQKSLDQATATEPVKLDPLKVDQLAAADALPEPIAPKSEQEA